MESKILVFVVWISFLSIGFSQKVVFILPQENSKIQYLEERGDTAKVNIIKKQRDERNQLLSKSLKGSWYISEVFFADSISTSGHDSIHVKILANSKDHVKIAVDDVIYMKHKYGSLEKYVALDNKGNSMFKDDFPNLSYGRGFEIFQDEGKNIARASRNFQKKLLKRLKKK